MNDVFFWVTVVLVLVAVGLLWAWRRERFLRQRLPAQARSTQRALEAEEQQRAAREAELTALYEAASDAVLVINADCHIQSMNSAAVKLFNAPYATGHSVIETTRHPEIDKLVTETLEGREASVRQVVIHDRLFQAHAVGIARGPGDAAPGGGVVLALEDVSELQRLGRARREMVANISHELRTPITSIGLLVETIEGGALSDEKLSRQLLDKIALELGSLRQLTQEMTDLAQLESGQSLLRLVPVDMARLANQAAARLASQAQRKQMQLRVPPEPGPQALADPDQILRVLTNLLHNAVKFTPAGGTIEVSWQDDGEWLVTSVADNGLGIAREERERVFERFYRTDRSRSGEGSGLGLAIARHIVQGHGGRIWVESELGEGATFKFSLPKPE